MRSPGLPGGLNVKKKDDGYKLAANNKKARHDYFIEETLEAGIVLTGTEIKSVREGKVSIKESYARVENGEVWLYGMNISPYKQGNRFNVDPLRPRKLLLHKREIRKLIGKVTLQGLTLVPLKIYINHKGLAKVEIAVARGKKNYDKRDTMAKRDAERKMDRAVKNWK
jgi:SsrA-binding protein